MARQLVTLQVADDYSFKVYLTDYEIEKCETDDHFKDELMKKYYELHKNGYIDNIQPTNDEQHFEEEDIEEVLPTTISKDDEEHLLRYVSHRPPLFDHRLPLKYRAKEVVTQLWEEIISNLKVNMTVDAVSRKFKSIRDSYIRCRASVNKKLSSGSSAKEKIEAEQLKNNHRNYELLSFLDETLCPRRTTSNLGGKQENAKENVDDDECASTSTSSINTLISSANASASKKRRCDSNLSPSDKVFFEMLGDIANKSESNRNQFSPSQYFCMRIADSLERLPRPLRNSVEVRILQIVTDAESSLE